MDNKNHEFRFPASKEELEVVSKFWKYSEPDMKKTGFMRRLFLLGVKEFQRQAIEKKKETLVNVINKD